MSGGDAYSVEMGGDVVIIKKAASSRNRQGRTGLTAQNGKMSDMSCRDLLAGVSRGLISRAAAVSTRRDAVSSGWLDCGEATPPRGT